MDLVTFQNQSDIGGEDLFDQSLVTRTIIVEAIRKLLCTRKEFSTPAAVLCSYRCADGTWASFHISQGMGGDEALGRLDLDLRANAKKIHAMDNGGAA